MASAEAKASGDGGGKAGEGSEEQRTGLLGKLWGVSSSPQASLQPCYIDRRCQHRPALPWVSYPAAASPSPSPAAAAARAACCLSPPLLQGKKKAVKAKMGLKLEMYYNEEVSWQARAPGRPAAAVPPASEAVACRLRVAAHTAPLTSAGPLHHPRSRPPQLKCWLMPGEEEERRRQIEEEKKTAAPPMMSAVSSAASLATASDAGSASAGPPSLARCSGVAGRYASASAIGGFSAAASSGGDSGAAGAASSVLGGLRPPSMFGAAGAPGLASAGGAPALFKPPSAVFTPPSPVQEESVRSAAAGLLARACWPDGLPELCCTGCPQAAVHAA